MGQNPFKKHEHTFTRSVDYVPHISGIILIEIQFLYNQSFLYSYAMLLANTYKLLIDRWFCLTMIVDLFGECRKKIQITHSGFDSNTGIVLLHHLAVDAVGT